jgi:ribosome maturation factor RimP
LWNSIESFLTKEHVELDDLQLSGRTLRVVVDKEGGIDLDHITDVSRGLSRLLDANEDLVPDSYNLEVTSPGLERHLRRPRQYEKAVGRAVRVKTTDGRALTGTLVAVDDGGFLVVTADAETRVPFDTVAKARTIFEFTATPKPGKAKR